MSFDYDGDRKWGVYQDVPFISEFDAKAALSLAGIKYTQVYYLQNEYWRVSDPPRPWFLFMTEFGPLKIGRRKRVIEVSWDDCPLRAIVTEDDVTKTDHYVHSYNNLDLVKYLTRWAELNRAVLKEKENA